MHLKTIALKLERLQLLKKLLAEQKIFDLRKSLNDPKAEKNPNYRILQKSILEQAYDDKDELVSGYRGAELPGSSRSGKTWSGVDIIIWLCLFVETNCSINIYRETYNEFKTTLYDDFKRRLDDFGLPNPFHNAKEVKSFKIGKNVISFLGDGKHGGGCDYAFFNEVMFISKSLFDQVEMRCRKFWWADYNPSFSEHWWFNSVCNRPDVVSLKTTYKDNPFISAGERNKILGYEPWRPGSYILKNDEIHCYNKLTQKVEVISDKNQPPPHPTNIKNGTADEYMWKVYGLGMRGAMKGQIFKNVNYIDKFPEDMAYSYGLDFGFTTDPCTLTKCAEDDANIWIELLSYHPMETSQMVHEFLEEKGIEKDLPIAADSADKYTSENHGAIEMVKDLKKKGWKISKVNKTRSVMFHLNTMKEKKIHIVINDLIKFAKTEQQNYKLREINGIFINQPVDQFNHMWDSARYRHMSFKGGPLIIQQTKSLSELGIHI